MVLASNNAEMRSGSGAFLDVGVATTSDGSVQLGDLGPSGERTLPVGAVPVTGDFERNWGWLNPSLDMRNLGLDAPVRCDRTAGCGMWTKLTGQPVDGVLSLDVAGLRQLLEATGPVQAGGQTVSADTVEQYLLHDQYAGLTDNATGTVPPGRPGCVDRRRAASAAGAEPQHHSLAIGPVLGRGRPAPDGVVQEPCPPGRVGGERRQRQPEPRSVDVSVINLGGNKLDQYLPVHVAVTTAPAGADTAVTLTTRMDNTTPQGQSQFIAGPFPGEPVAYGGYRGLISANLPARASHITMTGAGPLAVKGPEGPTWVVAAPVSIPQGTSSTVVVRFVMPGLTGR